MSTSTIIRQSPEHPRRGRNGDPVQHEHTAGGGHGGISHSRMSRLNTVTHCARVSRYLRLALCWVLPTSISIAAGTAPFADITTDWTDKPAHALMAPATLRVTIAGLQNASRDPKLDFWSSGLLWLLNQGLSGTRGLRLIPGYKVDSHLDPVQAQRIGLDVEAQRVLWASYNRQTGCWVVVAHLETVATGATSSDICVAGSNWVQITSVLTEKIVTALGFHTGKASSQVLTSSCDSCESVFEFLSQALSAEERQDAAAEANWARTATECDGACAEAHALLGAALGTQGDLQSAEEHLRTAVKLAPRCGGAHLLLGDLFMTQGHLQQARKEFQTALRAMPWSVEAMIREGECCEQQELLSDAQRCYLKAVQTDPLSALAHAHLGTSYALAGRRRAALNELRIASQQSDAPNVNTEQFLFKGYSALNELSTAISHGKTMLSLAVQAHVDPARIAKFRKDLADLQSRCTCHFVESSLPGDYSPSALAHLVKANAAQVGVAAVQLPLEASPEMTNWVQRIVLTNGSKLQRAKALFDALEAHAQSGFGKTRTASQAFSAWRHEGTMLSCQEYAYLYVALARAVGLRAYDVSVDEDCDGSKAPHACAAVVIGAQIILVDPAYDWFGAPHRKFQLLNDVQATAFHLMELGKLRYAQLAAKLYPSSDFVEGNLIQMMMVSQQWDKARAALRESREFSATARGKALYDYLEAYLAVHDGHPKEAVTALKSSLASNAEIATTYLLLGVAYWELGRLADAREAFRTGLQFPMDEHSYYGAKKAILLINEKISPEDN
jgi:Flp pilus assembly protein TadD